MASTQLPESPRMAWTRMYLNAVGGLRAVAVGQVDAL